VYLTYLTAFELPVHNIEHAADWRPVAGLVLNACPMAKLYINCWIPEGDSETASCHDKLTDNPDSPKTHQQLDVDPVNITIPTTAALVVQNFSVNYWSFKRLFKDSGPFAGRKILKVGVQFLLDEEFRYSQVQFTPAG
jgi:hypothetical protein